MVVGLTMLRRLRLLEGGDFRKGRGSDPDLFLKLADQRVSWRLVFFAVPTDNVPHTRIEGTIRGTLGQKDLIASNEEAACTGPHIAFGALPIPAHWSLPRGAVEPLHMAGALAEPKLRRSTPHPLVGEWRVW